MAHASCVARLDLATVTCQELEEVRGEFDLSIHGACDIHGLCVWFDVQFPGGTTLSTAPGAPPTHWGQTHLLLAHAQRAVQDTRLRGTLSLTPAPSCRRALRVQLEYRVDEEHVSR